MHELSETKRNEICKQALEAKKNIEWKFVELGALLHKIKTERYYEAGWSSWDEFEMELKLSSATVSKLLRIYEIFIVRFKFAPKMIAEAGGWSVVAEMLPVISEDTTREKVEELISLAKEQPRTHFRRTMIEEKRGAPCKHKETHEVRLTVCDNCGDRWKE